MTHLTSDARKILLVDDEPLILASLRAVLQASGHVVLEAATGEDAIVLIHEFQPDLAILDIFMPGMSGLELAKKLSEETDIAFMFISGSTETDIVRKATEYGAVGYLVKPFELQQIVPAINAALARSEDIKRLRQSEVELNQALSSTRETSMAVGLLMAKFQIDRLSSFDTLRHYARAHQCKVDEVAKQLLEAEELLVKLARHAAKTAS